MKHYKTILNFLAFVHITIIFALDDWTVIGSVLKVQKYFNIYLNCIQGQHLITISMINCMIRNKLQGIEIS